jgi:hypothetical protein
MYQMLRLIAATTAIAFASFPTSAPANPETLQIELTEKQIEAFIAAQKGLSAVVEKMQGAVFSDPVQSKHEAALERIVRKQGFKNFAEYELVSANISLVMAAIDPQTKAFSDPHTAIKKEIEDVRVDKTLPDRQKKQLLLELNEALKSVQPIEFPTNIELVRKYYDRIDVTIIAAYDGESRPTSTVVRTISE